MAEWSYVLAVCVVCGDRYWTYQTRVGKLARRTCGDGCRAELASRSMVAYHERRREQGDGLGTA